MGAVPPLSSVVWMENTLRRPSSSWLEMMTVAPDTGSWALEVKARTVREPVWGIDNSSLLDMPQCMRR